MKRTPTTIETEKLPTELGALITGAKIYDSSSSPEARVYYIEKDTGYYLKSGARGTLKREASMTSYFHKIGLAPEALGYFSTPDCDLLLTRRARGEDCTHSTYLENPKRLCDTIAKVLRELHERDFSTCPVKDRTSEYIAFARENYFTGNYDTSHFPDSFGYRCAEEAFAVLTEGACLLRSDTLIHGDFCLPNILLDSWGFSSFIDVGLAGVGDRHVDLFWGAWTLGFNLGTDSLRERFFDAYGRDRVDSDVLRVVGAAEVFG